MLMALKTERRRHPDRRSRAFIKVDPPQRAVAVAELRRELDVRPPAPRRRLPPGPPPCPVEKAGAVASVEEPDLGVEALPADRRSEYARRLAAIDAQWPAARASVKDLVDHIDYVVKKIGIDHVGISSDFDGGGGIDGWTSAADTFNVTLELVRRGYTEEQIGKIWSGNLLRVWSAVERVAKEIQAGRLK